MHLKKPVYEFRNFEEDENYFGCLCCGICGNSNIQNRLIEQMMVSDYTLAVENSVEFENYDDYNDSDGERLKELREIVVLFLG
uniref:Uncharacterized protein n=1 Tax=Panagrolaimus sp. ES5 TaxID=591445 RepID=A0AC34GNP7_9BILA